MTRPNPTIPRALVAAMAAGGLAFLTPLLSGCFDKEDPPVNRSTALDLPADTPASAPAASAPVVAATSSASLKRTDLMPLVIPGWQDKDGSRNGTVTLPEIGNDGQPVPDSDGEEDVEVSPREVVRLDDTHAVMLTETVPLDAQGNAIDSHPSTAWLGAYYFEQGKDGLWKLARRKDGVANLGFSGSIGSTRIERIAPQRFVLTVTSGSCWQGACGSWLAVYELGRDAVRGLATSIALSASNTGGDEGCEPVLEGKKPEEPPRNACFDIDGTPEFALGSDEQPGELRIVFHGKRTASEKNLRVETVDATVVYAYRQGAYVLGGGRNPVPAL